MAFLSGLLGSLGGPGNIIKSVGEFVSDSLSNLSQGKGLGGIAEAGSKAIKTLVGLPNSNITQNSGNQISNNRPMVITNKQIPRSAIRGNSVADARPIISTVNNQPRAKTVPVEKPLEQYEEYRGTRGGFPQTTMIKVDNKGRKYTTRKITDIVEPGTKLTKGQKRRLKKKFRNYM
jgi:hypothetical protein